MSNLIINGDFSTFTIDPNTYMYDTDFTSDQTTLFYWSFTSPYLSLQNSVTDFQYPDPLGITTQYLSLQTSASIQQTINIIIAGTYVISFYYCVRQSGFILNPIQIYFNNFLIDTITTDPGTEWIQ